MPENAPIERWPDDLILRKASQGDEEAFGIFCQRSLPSLYRYVRKQCRQCSIAEDLAPDFCHEAVIRALKFIRACAVSGHRPLPTVSQAWLSQIAVNVMYDWARRERRVVLVDQIEAESLLEVSQERIQEHEEVLKFLNWLPNRERDMLELVFLEEKTIVEAGNQLSITQANSYKVFHRALELLRDLLAEHGGKIPQRSETD